MIRKAIVPMAGLGTRLYPIGVVLPKGLMPFALADGRLTTGLQLISETLLRAGIEQIGVVVSPENRAVYEAFLEGGDARYAPSRAKRPEMQCTYESLRTLRCHLTLIEQPQLLGLGHAVWCAHAFANREPVLVFLGDHIPLPLGDPAPIQQVVRLYEDYHCPVYGVHRVPLDKVSQYGILRGAPTDAPRTYHLLQLHEKPTPEYAQQHLHTEGLAPNEFFAHSGVYAFPPALWSVLEQLAEAYDPAHGEWTLTHAQQHLLQQSPAYLFECPHHSLDFGAAREYRQAFCYLAGCNDV
ncbi:MAG: UTP--glucose-1-phosphate uridylyltransferase [Fimbriimonadales bacterium]|nr:MAG: UTP--glucose-1-phosphate uridylyltransferase [Fimbriimonadales bacterium]GIV07989.1 MAG: UTP--glucose-1-phosphate uridylyltransferase [Fimbriimonadales bacterium]